MLKERKINMDCLFSKIFLLKQLLRKICFLLILLQLVLITLLPHIYLFLSNLPSFQPPLNSLNQLMIPEGVAIKSVIKCLVKHVWKCGTGALNKRSNTQQKQK